MIGLILAALSSWICLINNFILLEYASQTDSCYVALLSCSVLFYAVLINNNANDTNGGVHLTFLTGN